VVVSLQPGQQVTAVTGDVVTTYAPAMAVVRAEWLGVHDPAVFGRPGPFPGKNGDIFYPLVSLGERWYRSWYKGQIITVKIPGGLRTAVECAAEACGAQRLGGRDIENQWWVRIRDREGHEGWAIVSGGAFRQRGCAH
jgi:hypothetical protein